MDDIMFLIALISVPLAATLVFLLFLFLYRKEKKKAPSSDDTKALQKLKNLHTACAVTGVIAGIFVFTVAAGAILFMMFMKSM